jgi:hypothetical protein
VFASRIRADLLSPYTLKYRVYGEGGDDNLTFYVIDPWWYRKRYLRGD